MKAKRRLEITTETHEVTVIRFGQDRPAVYCPSCRAQARFLSPIQAASIFSLPESAVDRLTREEKLHSTRDADGTMLLCGTALAAQVEKIKNKKE